MIVVDRVTTPVSLSQIRDYVHSAYRYVVGKEPTKNQVVNLSTLVAIETRQGQSMKNNNPGNAAASSKYTGKAWRPPWYEITEASSDRDKHLNAEMLAGRAPSAFKAFDTLEQGFRDFIAMLMKTFPEVMNASKNPSADAFRKALSKKYSKDYENPRSTPTFEKLQKQLGGTAGTIGFGIALVGLAGFGGTLAYRRMKR